MVAAVTYPFTGSTVIKRSPANALLRLNCVADVKIRKWVIVFRNTCKKELYYKVPKILFLHKTKWLFTSIFIQANPRIWWQRQDPFLTIMVRNDGWTWWAKAARPRKSTEVWPASPNTCTKYCLYRNDLKLNIVQRLTFWTLTCT